MTDKERLYNELKKYGKTEYNGYNFSLNTITIKGDPLFDEAPGFHTKHYICQNQFAIVIGNKSVEEVLEKGINYIIEHYANT